MGGGERGQLGAKRPESRRAKIARLHSNMNLGEGAQTKDWAGEFRVVGEVCQPECLYNMLQEDGRRSMLVIKCNSMANTSNVYFGNSHR